MSSASLGTPYVFNDDSAKKLIELEKRRSAPVSTPGFQSRLGTPQQLDELVDRLKGSTRRSSDSSNA